MNNSSFKSYHIPNENLLYQEVIKKSRFIVHIEHTSDVAAAKEFISQIRSEYSEANHNCWAYVAGEPDNSQILGFSDDGEPNGTAGKPMLNVLLGSKVGEVAAVVTRYFGGIKLGTGGLARAYGGSLKNALETLKTIEKIPKTTIYGTSEYSHQSVIEKLLEKYKILDTHKTYTEKVTWEIIMDARDVSKAIADITENTSGRALFYQSDDL